MLTIKAFVEEIRDVISCHNYSNAYLYKLACINEPKDTILSASLKNIKFVKNFLQKASIKCVNLKINFAFYLAQIDPILNAFKEIVCTNVIF